MKKFSIHLDSFVVSLVEAAGDEGRYHVPTQSRDTGAIDFVVTREGREVVRVPRENILYVMISEVSTT